jgi:hypothetical protein
VLFRLLVVTVLRPVDLCESKLCLPSVEDRDEVSSFSVVAPSAFSSGMALFSAFFLPIRLSSEGFLIEK